MEMVISRSLYRGRELEKQSQIENPKNLRPDINPITAEPKADSLNDK